MLTISKSLSAGQARTYHAREFTSERQNYWSRDQQGHSEWQGKLANDWGLHGSVGAEEFARLSEGRHPESDTQLVKHQPAKTYDNRYGKQITSSEHRAGWDATFSAPKSVSLTALVGGDDRVREAHRESVRIALHELERYTQARIGNVHAPETTGKFIAATFEHDTARPVDGYAAPQLHTHAVVFNMTERDNGQIRALQERSLFQSQHYATSVYRSELAMKLQGLGYEIERGKHGQPEIKGYSEEYLEASSPRRVQIKEHLQEIGREGAGAAQVAAHRTRDSKELHSLEEVLQQHRELQSHGVVNRQEYLVQTLVPRQELTGADRSWAQQYRVDDILRYSRSSKETGIRKDEYTRVVSVDAKQNTLTVVRASGEQTTYDPRRQVGVSVYREQERSFSVGDRIQFTAPNQELKVANRELGTVQGIAHDGTMRLKLDNERSVVLNPQRHPHLDHGYAVTSYSSQGQTAERVLVHVDTELGAKDLLNSRMAYVSISRGQWDAQIFTDNLEKLPKALGHDVSHKNAYKQEQVIALPQPEIVQPKHDVELSMGFGLSL